MCGTCVLGCVLCLVYPRNAQYSLSQRFCANFNAQPSFYRNSIFIQLCQDVWELPSGKVLVSTREVWNLEMAEVVNVPHEICFPCSLFTLASRVWLTPKVFPPQLPRPQWWIGTPYVLLTLSLLHDTTLTTCLFCLSLSTSKHLYSLPACPCHSSPLIPVLSGICR